MSDLSQGKPRVIIEGNTILRLSKAVQYIRSSTQPTPTLDPVVRDAVRRVTAYNGRLFGIIR